MQEHRVGGGRPLAGRVSPETLLLDLNREVRVEAGIVPSLLAARPWAITLRVAYDPSLADHSVKGFVGVAVDP